MTNENTPIIESFDEVEETVALAAPAAPRALATSDAATWCSLQGADRATGLAVFDALSNAESLDDHVGEVITVHDLATQTVALTDAETGEVRNTLRIVLMCDEGNFATCSTGVYTSLNNLICAIGAPTWEPGIPLRVEKKKGTRGYKFTSLVLA